MTANYSTREYREKLYDDLHVRLRDTAILMCAIFIASIGLNTNSTAVIIGAMLISPLMTPIVGLGFGLANGNVRFLLGALYLFLINCVFIMLANIVGTRILMRKSPLTSFKELSIKMRIGLISLIVLLLMKLSLPDIQGTRVEKGEKLEKSVWSFRHLTLGVVAIFFYVGVEVCIGANINLYAIEMDYASPALMATLYWGGMLVGRLVGSSLSRISPRVQLTVTTVSAGLLALLAILLNNPWLLTAVGLFHSIMWGAIFTLSVAHLGKYTSVASGVFMIGVVGGAILPLVQGVLADVLGGWRWSWFIVLFGETFMLYYALIGSRVRQTCDNL